MSYNNFYKRLRVKAVQEFDRMYSEPDAAVGHIAHDGADDDVFIRQVRRTKLLQSRNADAYLRDIESVYGLQCLFSLGVVLVHT